MRFFPSSLSAAMVLRYIALFPTFPINVLRAFGTEEAGTGELIYASRVAADGSILPLINPDNLILDCGAWTLNQGNAKRKINVVEYAKFLKKYGHHFLFYMNLDEVFVDEGTGEFDDRAIATNLVNQDYLEAQGLTPVPVIHDLSDAEIDFYIKRKTLKNYEYIAIGSNQVTRNNTQPLVNAIDKLYHAGYKIHLFGVGNYNMLYGLKIWSCDASSYVQHAKHGVVIFYSYIEAKEVNFSFVPTDKKGKYSKDYIYHHKPEVIAEYEDAILKPLGLTITDLFVSDVTKTFANLYYYTLLEKMLTDIQVRMGITFDRW